jgi:hypothetical protein
MQGGNAQQAQSHQGQMSTQRGGSHGMAQDMKRLMERMHQMTDQMHGIMARERAMTPDHQRQMAQAMEQMSRQLQQMAQHMRQGELSENRFHQMEQDMDRTFSMIRELE